MRRVGWSGAASRVYAWRLEWRPLLVLLALFLVGFAISVWGLYTFSLEAYTAGSVFLAVLEWGILFWVAVYAVIEFVVWRKTRNVGHRLQFLGAMLICVGVAQFWIPMLFGGWSAAFSAPGMFAEMLGLFVLFPLGIVLGLVGYLYRGFRARDVDVYRNLVVREGERIQTLTDGYTERPLHLPYPDLEGVDVRGVAPAWAKFLGRAGLSLGHRIDGTGITMYPSTYTGIGTLRLWTALVHVFWLLRHSERLTWVRVGWDRQVSVHLSPYDYERVARPVAHHLLCAVVADALVTSLIAYARRQRGEAVSLAAGQAPGGRRVRLPASWHDWAGHGAALAAAVLVIAGLGSAFTAAVTSTAHGPARIATVEYPPTPAPGATIDVYARLAGLDEFWDLIETFTIHLDVYFNATGGGTREMRHVEGATWGVRLGPYPEGTEIVFGLALAISEFDSPPMETTLVVAGPFTMTVGRIVRGGSSGLAIGTVTTQVAGEGNATFRMPITSAAGITRAQLLVDFGYGVYALNLTFLGGAYEATVAYLVPPSPITVRIFVAAQDASWNSASVGPLHVELMR